MPEPASFPGRTHEKFFKAIKNAPSLIPIVLIPAVKNSAFHKPDTVFINILNTSGS
jgi:hypothetical protein